MRHADESRERKKKQAPIGSNGGAGQAPIFTFRPDAEDRKNIRSMNVTMVEIILKLETYLQSDCTLTWGYKPENQAYYVIMRTRSAHWADGLAVSAWHADLETAVYSLYYALTVKLPMFPERLPIQAGFDNNW